jgi:hypothetical protein
MEYVAWPAGTWFAIETGLRSATGDPGGAALSFGWCALAAATVFATRLRLAAIRA